MNTKFENHKVPEDNERKQFGNRLLVNEDDVYLHNAWDRIEWNKEQIELAKEKIKLNSNAKISKEDKEQYFNNAYKLWDQFYITHQDKFFKDRHWLFTEFNELQFDSNVILEVGCGVGNTIFPILSLSENKNSFVYCCDFSPTAISLIKSNKMFDEKRCLPFVCDLTKYPYNFPFPESSIDIITMIFTLSSIVPSKMLYTIKNLVKYLKPNGLLLFRDYGRYDMAQLRFKKGHCIDDNLYVRGDGTIVYFFEPEEVDKLLTESGLEKVSLFVDKRLQINRSKQLKMYRIWIQAKYKKKSNYETTEKSKYLT